MSIKYHDQTIAGTLTMDDTPTIGNTSHTVSSDGIKKELNTKAPVYGFGKNILSNWYFCGGGSQQGHREFPINDRGETTYTGTTTTNITNTINNWYLNPGVSAARILAIQSDNIKLSFADFEDGEAGKGVLFSNNFSLQVGEYILSVLIDGISGEWSFGGSFPGGFVSETGLWTCPITITDSLVSTNNGRFHLTIGKYQPMYTSDYIEIRAIKLERGIEQTLAHNEGTDDSPEWVLNEAPNFEEELLKSRISQGLDSSYDNIDIQEIKKLSNTGSLTYSQIGQAIQDAAAAPNTNGFHPLTTVDSSPTAENINHLITSAAVWAATEGFGLGKNVPTPVASYDAVTKTGFYYAAQTATGAPPVQSTCVFIHINYPVSSGNSAVQIASSVSSNYLFVRWEQTNVWTAWKPLSPNIVRLSGRTINTASDTQMARIPTTGTNALITTDSVVLSCIFANATGIVGDVNWESFNGYIVLTGTCTTATTADIIIAY